ncbi:MAG: transcriptional repressor, partial [Paramuribaculum sp.]|nr:transcriptional repressor [Paramuribaculum sp.]
MKEAEEILQRKGVKPTPNRIIVLDALIKTEHPTNISELESIIKTIDKSSIFRALNLFLEYGIVHGLEDGSGSLKYE